MGGIVGSPEVQRVAGEVSERLHRVLAKVGRRERRGPRSRLRPVPI
jgi:hypothetical protein